MQKAQQDPCILLCLIKNRECHRRSSGSREAPEGPAGLPASPALNVVECWATKKISIIFFGLAARSRQLTQRKMLTWGTPKKHSNKTTKEPNPIAKGMSWMNTNVQLAINDSDKTIADLITDGCNMGVKSLSRYLNQYKAASEKAKDIAKKLISLEERLVVDLRAYL